MKQMNLKGTYIDKPTEAIERRLFLRYGLMVASSGLIIPAATRVHIVRPKKPYVKPEMQRKAPLSREELERLIVGIPARLEQLTDYWALAT